MSDLRHQHIWNPSTGIQDLDQSDECLALRRTDVIVEEWQRLRSELDHQESVSAFTRELRREWAIETGVIEDLYYVDRGVTQTLIEQGFVEALLPHGSTNKPRDYVLALMRDQESALQFVFDFVRSERLFSVGWIKELHHLMTLSQVEADAWTPDGVGVSVPPIQGDWKKLPNYPMRGGTQFHYCPPEQTASEMERLVQLHLTHEERNWPSEASAAWLHHRFTQIHPFQDGNGRTARALASFVLIKAGLFPLLVTRDEKTAYLESLELADGGDLKPLARYVALKQEMALLMAKSRVLRQQ